MNNRTPEAFQTCSRCGLTKALEQFPLKNVRSARRQSHCRSCKAHYQREWYQRNRARHIRNVAARNRRHRAKNRAIVEEAKNRPCADCGKRYPPCVMDFDHVRGEKLFNVSEKMGVATEAALRAEIVKCEVVCANCHRLRTYGPSAGAAAAYDRPDEEGGSLFQAFESSGAYVVPAR